MRWIAVLCAAMVLVACESAPKDRSPAVQAASQPNAGPQQLSNTDPCAMQLHDLCGSLLLYYMEYGSLPERLGDIQPSSDLNPVVILSCPVSSKPYVYDAKGMPAPDGAGWVIVYDSAPVHLGMRFAIVIEQPRVGQPLVARVVALPESFFREHGVK